MILIPAIDIKDKKCVRVFKGDFDKETIYSNSPKEVSLKWISAGASLIHLVDLDGALEGQSINFEVIKKILEIITERTLNYKVFFVENEDLLFIEYKRVIPHLIKALQEAVVRIEALEAA